jgi:hypothetical protein
VPLGLVVFVVVVGVPVYALWILGIRYATERRGTVGADGTRYDILVHRDGVVLVTSGESVFAGAYLIFPTLLDLFRRWRRGPWRWAVTVRRAPFPGYIDLLREVFPDQEAARNRADELGILIRRGERLWPIAAEH